MNHGVVVASLAAALVLTACSDHSPRPPAEPTPEPAAAPSYDPALEPAAAVLALVPADAATVTVTDFEQVRLQLGLPELGSDAAPEEQGTFWQRAERERPLLSDGMLREHEERLQRRYGFGQLDVEWEATLLDDSDRKVGWVLAFRPGTDMAAVAGAVRDEAPPLAGGVVDPVNRLVSVGTTTDGAGSWAADPETAELVGLPAAATYVSRACVPGSTGADVDELGPWSLQFEGTLVTARLGAGRQDLFTRMRLATSSAQFTRGFDGGVADPSSGRIGYRMTDPPTAARLALRQQLPFATCA